MTSERKNSRLVQDTYMCHFPLLAMKCERQIGHHEKQRSSYCDAEHTYCACAEVAKPKSSVMPNNCAYAVAMKHAEVSTTGTLNVQVYGTDRGSFNRSDTGELNDVQNNGADYDKTIAPILTTL